MADISKCYVFLTLTAICFLTSPNTQALSTNCKWVFDTCIANWTLFGCDIKAVWSKPDGTKCLPLKEDFSVLNATKYCSAYPFCRTNEIYCAWSPWASTSFQTCGEMAGKFSRKKERCCHPITGVRLSLCFVQDTVKETKNVSWAPCTTSDGKNTPMIVMLSVFLPVVILTVIACILRLFYKHLWNHRRAPQAIQVRTLMPQAPPAVYPNPMFVPDSGNLAPSQINDQRGQAMSSNDTHPEPSAPPSYEETQRQVIQNDYLPPKYDVAVNYATD